MAVSCSSSLSSCPTEKGSCAYISTPLIKLLKAELKPSAMCRHLAAVQLILHLVLLLKNGRLKVNWGKIRKTVAHYCQLIPCKHFYSLQETGLLQESRVNLVNFTNVGFWSPCFVHQRLSQHELYTSSLDVSFISMLNILGLQCISDA